MVSKINRRIIQRPSGIGSVRDEEIIAEVQYQLVIGQTFNVTQGLSGPATEIPGLRDTTGVVIVLSGEKDLMSGYSGPLTLELEDGREWGFFATHGDPISGQYQVVQASEGTLASGI